MKEFEVTKDEKHNLAWVVIRDVNSLKKEGHLLSYEELKRLRSSIDKYIRNEESVK